MGFSIFFLSQSFTHLRTKSNDKSKKGSAL